MGEKKEDQRPRVLPIWLVAGLSSALTAMLISALRAISECFYPVVSVLLNTISKETMALMTGISLGTALLLLGYIFRLRSYYSAPFSERFKFDASKGFHVDKNGLPLCPICLNADVMTRIRVQKAGAGYCAEHQAVVGPLPDSD